MNIHELHIILKITGNCVFRSGVLFSLSEFSFRNVHIKTSVHSPWTAEALEAGSAVLLQKFLRRLSTLYLIIITVLFASQAVRSTHGLEVPLSHEGKLLVGQDYLHFLTQLANQKMEENLRRINRLVWLWSLCLFSLVISQSSPFCSTPYKHDILVICYTATKCRSYCSGVFVFWFCSFQILPEPSVSSHHRETTTPRSFWHPGTTAHHWTTGDNKRRAEQNRCLQKEAQERPSTGWLLWWWWG